jgi:3-oxoacyl-[acyl-carrier-protein] synthase II
MTLVNMAGACVAIRHGLRGPSLCHASACTTGAMALGEAARVVALGEADVMVAGASEAALTGFMLAGFASMHALSTRNDEPERASRPFDRDRDGFVAGEGAGVLVLEALEHAARRGARIRAELVGYGASSDASHVAAPAEDGRGAEQCMRRALASAGVGPGEVGYVNAHATGTPLGDRVEARALAAVLGEHVGRVPVSSTKGAMGHLLGAAGAVEALVCVRTLETGMLPPTLNLDRPDPDDPLDHVAWKSRPASPRTALSNSFGFGGANVSLLFQRWEG